MTAPAIVAKSWSLPFTNGARRSSGALTDTTPDAFTFTPQTGVARNTQITSSPITVAGINSAADVTVSGGTWNKNGGAYSSAAGTVVLGDVVRVRQTSSASYSTATTATLTIGGVSAIFSATTLANPALAFNWYVSSTIGSDSNNGTTAATPFATLTAAFAAVQPGQTIALMNGNYSGWTSTKNGTALARISLVEYTGHAPVITGSVGSGTSRSNAQLNHNYWNLGSGIRYQGDNTGATASWQSATIYRGISVNASNVTIGGIFRNHKEDWIRVTPGNTGVRFSSIDCDTAGTLFDGTVSGDDDAGDGINIPHTASGATGNILMEGASLRRGGHNAFASESTGTVLLTNTLVTNEWVSVFGAGKGARAGIFRDNSQRSVMENSVWHSMLDAVNTDNAQGSVNGMKAMSQNMLFKKCFFLNHGGGDGMIAIQAPADVGDGGDPGASDQRWAHCTFHLTNGSVIKIYDTGAVVGIVQPIRFTNCIFSGANGSQVIDLRYRSSRSLGQWYNVMIFDTCIFASNYAIKITDTNNSHAVINTTVNGIAALYSAAGKSANWANITVGSPGYATSTIPSSTVPATAFAQAQTAFASSAGAAAGTYLTSINGQRVAQTALVVDDAKWFRDPMGWSDIAGDTIYIEGVGTRVISAIAGNTITVTQSTTVADNARVYLGTSATPNIGAA